MAALAVLFPMFAMAQSQTPPKIIHIVPKRSPQSMSAAEAIKTASGITQAGPSGAHLNYYAGPVIANVTVVVVFWGSTVNSTTQSGIAGFYTALKTSHYLDQLNEYTTTGATVTGGGTSTNQTLGEGGTVAAYTITPSVCNAPSTTCNLTNAQIASELVSQITAAHLPAPTYDASGNNPNTLYMIYFPPKVVIDDGTGALSCQQWCGYHSTGTYSAKNIAYGVLPDFGAGSGCELGCGTGSTVFNNLTMVSSHEYAEAITDPAVGYASTYGPPLGWYDTVNGEVGDICNQYQYTSANAGGYSIQLEWSDIQGKCVDGPAYIQLNATTTQTAGVPFSLSAAIFDVAGGGFTYTRNVHFTSSDVAANLPGDGAFTTPYSITLNTPGTRTITLTDSTISSITGTISITVLSGTTQTSTSIAALPNPATPSQSITFTATVREQNVEAVPTGQVQFKDGASNLGAAATLSNGQASLATTSLTTPGIHSITANYLGSGSVAASSSTNFPQMISDAGATANTLALTASPTTSTENASVTFAATMTPTAATGSVLFQAYTNSTDTVTLGSATLVAGVASVNTSSLKPGMWTIKASYSGDSTYQPSSQTISHVRLRKMNPVRTTNP